LKVVEAVSQGRALWIATCNNIKGLPPELRRRYIFGTFFFDLPSIEERKLIWNIYYEKFGLKKDLPKPPDTGWTGAEIKNCCDIASRFNASPKEAAGYIIPLAVSAAEQIASLRREADSRYVSAATPGAYKAPEGMEYCWHRGSIGRRKVSMEEPQPEGEVEVVAVAVTSKKRKIDPGAVER
jgi:hypothetical protein